MRRLIVILTAIMLSRLCIFPVCALQDEILARLGRGMISDIEFSPDSSILAVLTSKGIYFHNPSDFADLAFIDMGLPAQYGGSICFSPDGKLLASPTREMTEAVVLWNTETLEKVAEIKAERYSGYVGSIDFSPDGKLIAFGGSDGKIRLLDVIEREEVGILDTGDNMVESICFSPNGSMLGSVSLSQAAMNIGISVKLWDMATQEIIKTFRSANGIAFSPDSTLFAIRETNKVIRLYDMEQNEKGVLRASGYSSLVDFSPDGKLLASKGYAGIKLWDVENLEVVDKTAADCPIEYTQFSPDGRYLAFADINKAIVWDMVAQRKIESSDEYMGNIKSVAISADGRWLACGDPHSAKLWDLETYELLSIFETTRFGIPFIPYTIDISSDNRFLAAGSWNHDKVMVWDIESGAKAAVIDVEADEIPYTKSVAFSPDSELLAFGGSGGLQLWDMKTQKDIELSGNPGSVHSIAFDTDGKFLISGGGKETVHIWDTNKGRIADELKSDFIVYSIAYSSDGQWLAAGGLHANEVKLWDMQSLKEVNTFDADWPAGSVAFGNNGCLLAFRSGYSLILWDVVGQEKLATLPAASYITCTPFSPDGRLLASGSAGEVILWDMEPYANICDGQSVDSTGKQEVLWGRIKSESIKEQGRTALEQNYPNPFNPETWIPFRLSESGHVAIKIYSSTGQLIRIIDLGKRESGTYLNKEKAAYWDGKNQQGESSGSGIYFYQLATENNITTMKKMFIVR